jgi:pimeloyl-ACP methyl ester carboxylesterase
MNEKDLLRTIEQLVLRAAPGDWFERIDDRALAACLRLAPQGTRDLLVRCLGLDRALRFVADLERRVDLGLDRLALATASAPDPDLPAVILLPGFMGVHLNDASAGRVWLDPASALRGDLSARAALDATGAADAFPGEHLMPDGLVRLVYADLLQALRARGHAVHAFPFDFRRSVRATALLLGDFVRDILARSRGEIILVGHSMGALLACLLPYHLPELAARLQQTIFLGAPLGGSFDAVEAVTGTHWILPRLVALSPDEDSRDFQSSLATWPGLFGILPDPEVFTGCTCERVFDAAEWPSAVPVRQSLLDEGLALKTMLRESPLFRLGRPVTQLFATRYPTIGSLATDTDGALAAGPRTAQGDGVVAAFSAFPPGVTGYRTGFPHTLAPIEPAAIEAIVALIQTGECALDPIHTEDLHTELPPGGAPEVQMALGMVESGAESLKDGILTFPAVAWLLSPVR